MNYKEFLLEKYKKPKYITVEEASKRIGKSQQWVRVAMQRNLINIGTCVKKEGKTRYDYYISPHLLDEFLRKQNKVELYII